MNRGEEPIVEGMKSRLWTGWASGLAMVLLAGCGGGTKSPSEAPGSPETAGYTGPEPAYVIQASPGKRGGRLILSGIGDPKTFNPVTENESSSEEITRLVFAGLSEFDWPTQTARPGMAESFEVEEDGRTWTIRLRRNLKWSDGRDLTMEDVVFTWNQVVYNPDIDNPSRDLFTIEGNPFEITKIDDLTLRVVTPGVYAPFVEFFGGVPILPKHICGPMVDAGEFESGYGINSDPASIVGSGPYVIKQFKPGEFTLLVRNPYYYKVDSEGQRLPYIDEVIQLVVPDLNAMSLRFQKGETHAYESVRPAEYDRFRKEADQGKFQLYDLGLSPAKAFFWFNLNTGKNPEGKPFVDPAKLGWFRNTKFRQAISYAIDRDSIIKSVYAGRAERNYGYVSPSVTKWYNPNTAQYPYNIEKARALLKEIGIEDRDGDGFLEDEKGKRIEFTMNTNTGNDVREKKGVLIQEDLKRLGIKVNFQPLDFNTLVSKITASFDYECALLSLGGGATDPIASSNVLRSSGFTHFWFPKQEKPSSDWEARIDELMDLQASTLDEAKRKAYYDEIQSIMAEQVPFIFTVAQLNYAACSNTLGNVQPTVLSSYRITWNLEELYFKP